LTQSVSRSRCLRQAVTGLHRRRKRLLQTDRPARCDRRYFARRDFGSPRRSSIARRSGQRPWTVLPLARLVSTASRTSCSSAVCARSPCRPPAPLVSPNRSVAVALTCSCSASGSPARDRRRVAASRRNRASCASARSDAQRLRRARSRDSSRGAASARPRGRRWATVTQYAPTGADTLRSSLKQVAASSTRSPAGRGCRAWSPVGDSRLRHGFILPVCGIIRRGRAARRSAR